jgi:glycosyltransferase involved in cell wall biosynthesis
LHGADKPRKCFRSYPAVSLKRSAYIISVKYAPGSNKEFVIFGDNLQRKGFDVRYILAHPYKDLEWVRKGSEFLTVSDGLKNVFIDFVRYLDGREIMQMFSSYPPSFICFYNPHPLNPVIAGLVRRKFPEAVISVYLHDPYKPDKSSYGWKKSLYISIAEKVQDWTVRYMDHVISPSGYSQKLFRLRHPSFSGETHLAPLLVPDTFGDQDCERKYFSMVGTAHKATGHDTFVDLVNYVAELNEDFKFCLISSPDISNFTNKLTNKGRNILRIINKRIITDSEIDDVIRHSYAVFRLAREVTQSGVIPVSYMNAAPVIATDIPGHSQHVWHKETGCLVSADPSFQEIIQAMEYVKSNFDTLSKKARKSYGNIWAEWNFKKYYGWIIRGLKG